MMTPAAALFQMIEQMTGQGGYAHTAEARAELRSRFGYDVRWTPTPDGPTAEVVEAGAPSQGGGFALERDVADSPQTQNAPGGQPRGVPVNPSSGALLKGTGYDRPEPRAEADRASNFIPGDPA